MAEPQAAGQSGSGPDPAAARRTQPTRAEVARMAGVSTAVVSYVVNNGPRPVKKATAARVREAMDLLGYVPNASARALRLGRTHTIGLIMSNALNPFFTEYTSELVKAADARGWRLLIADSRNDEATEAAIVEEFVARQVDGLLFASTYARLDRSRTLQSTGIPTVQTDSPWPIPGRRTVGTDYGASSEMLVRHLLEHGRRRIALIIGDEGFGFQEPRELGWRRALRSAGLADGPIVRAPFSREGGYAGAGALLDQHPDIDAVFASNDLQGVGLARALHERGVRIPADVAVVTFDGTKESEFCWPPLTVARQRLPELAAAAIRLMDAPDLASGTHFQLEADLIFRESCGCTADSIQQTQVDVLTRSPNLR